MKVVMLGIDPGFSFSGWGIVVEELGKTKLIAYGYLKLPTSKELPERIAIFYDFFTQKIKEHQVTDLALETPFLGKNAQNFLKLGYLRGNLYLLSHQHNIKLHEFAPREVKLAVTGYGGAEKEQVARMIIRMFNITQDIQKADVTDAIAVTVCGIWQRKHRNSLAQQYLAKMK